MDAARELFATHGYTATTTYQIAKKAGVERRLVFANFGSKAQLFEATVITPFSRWIDDYLETWERDPQAESNEELTRNFVVGFYALARQNRDILLRLVGAGAQGSDDISGPAAVIRTQLGSALHRINEITIDAGKHRGVRGLDPPASMAVTAGAVLAAALLDDWVNPPGEPHPSDERIIDELTATLVYGLHHRP